MSTESDEIEVFFRQQRRRGLKRGLAVLVLAAAGYLAYTRAPHDVDRLFALSEEIPADDPRALVSASSSGSRAAELEPYRHLFSRTLPAWVDELRRFRKLEAASSGGDREALAKAREQLLKDVATDEQLRTVLTTLTGLAERSLTEHVDQIDALFPGLNVILAQRGLPFTVSGSVTRQEELPTLVIRAYEQVGDEIFHVQDTPLTVRYFDRLDLTHLDRDPELQAAKPEQPDVSLRAVTTAANGMLLAALNPEGYWRLTAITPASAELIELEKHLGQLVNQEWRKVLEAQVPLPTLQALERVSSQVARRNALYRRINERGQGRAIMLEPSNVTLGWAGHAWLDQMEPYAVQGRVSLNLEDIEQIRAWDRETAVDLPASAPALRMVLREQIRRAAVGQVARVWLRERESPVPALVARRAPDDAEVQSLHFAARLTQLIETPRLCQSLLATFASDALDSATGAEPAAQLVLERLAGLGFDQPHVGPENIAQVVAQLENTSCEALSERARTVYKNNYGTYVPVRRAVVTVADRSEQKEGAGTSQQ